MLPGKDDAMHRREFISLIAPGGAFGSIVMASRNSVVRSCGILLIGCSVAQPAAAGELSLPRLLTSCCPQQRGIGSDDPVAHTHYDRTAPVEITEMLFGIQPRSQHGALQTRRHAGYNVAETGYVFPTIGLGNWRIEAAVSW